MTDTITKRRRNKSGSALRNKVRALRTASGERSESHPGSTAALTPMALLRRADGPIYESDYWAFIKGSAVVGADVEFDPRCADAEWQEKAKQLLLFVPNRLNFREKGFLHAIVRWSGPGAIPVEHRMNVHRLYCALNDFEEAP
jgi:hypothetical protein